MIGLCETYHCCVIYIHIGVYSSAVYDRHNCCTYTLGYEDVVYTIWYLVSFTSLALVLLVGIPRVRIYREEDAANVYAETGNRLLQVQLSKNGLHQGGAVVVRDVSSWRLLSCCLILAAGRVRSKKKKNGNKIHHIPSHPKYTTKSAAAPRP